ncbi:MAG: MIP family channel protein [Eubacterium sp.]|nr:MIP family channel protein [Eubacterium sp.]
MKKYLAEFIGTFTLVFVGCGTAMLVGCDSENGGGYILTAFAFGLAIVMMAYGVGNISGGHVNPAVSLGVLLSGGMTVVDFCGYVIAQIIGAFVGSFALSGIFSMGNVEDKTGGLGTNGLAGVNSSIGAGLIIEIILTFLFVILILGVTSKNQSHGSFGGLIIGLTLVGIHIIGIGLTGTSVNPARSLGPAIVCAIKGNTDPISVVWVFIVAPMIGAALAAFCYKFLEDSKKDGQNRLAK